MTNSLFRRRKIAAAGMEIIHDVNSIKDKCPSNPVSPTRRRSRSRNHLRSRSDSKSAKGELSIRKRLRTTRRQSDVVMGDESLDMASLRSDIELLKSQINCIEEDHMELSRMIELEGGALSYLETTPVRE